MVIFIGIVHTDAAVFGIGSDGEAENISSDEIHTPTVTLRNTNLHQQQFKKRMSLPANTQIPSYFLEKFSNNYEQQPMSRRLRRASLVRSNF